MPWSDPTDYSSGTLIPTTSGAEALNFNTKVVAKLRTLFDYLHGDDDLDFLFQTGSTPTNQIVKDFKLKLPEEGGSTALAIRGTTSGTVVRIDSVGQLREGKLNSQIVDAFYPDTTTAQNIRILAPFTFKATELTMSCDDTMGIGAGGTLSYRVLNTDAGTIGTVSIVPTAST